MGQMTQPTVLHDWRMVVSQSQKFNVSISINKNPESGTGALHYVLQRQTVS